MPKASLAALLTASAFTVVPFNVFAQAAGTTEAQPAATAPDTQASEASESSTANAGGAPAAEPAPAAPAPTQPGPLLPGMAMAGTEPTSVAQPKSSASATENKADSVLAEDWWSHARPSVEFHGYFRTRAEMFHNFSLGRRNDPERSLWPQPYDNRYTSFEANNNAYGPDVCTRPSASENDSKGCRNKTQSSANLRLRLDPEIHISDNLRVITQIDILDNAVMGSTPSGYANTPAAGGGYAVVQRNGYTPLSFFDNTVEPPSAGINGFKDSVRVKRAWAEYSTPVGQLRFGRMPDHFGLGMVHNSGDGYDHDYQSTIDRIMFITNVKPLDLYVGGSWDFPSEGKTSESLQYLGGQPHDMAQLDDVSQYSLLLMRRKNPQLEKMALSRGELVLNFGSYITYRKQMLAADASGGGSGVNNNCTNAAAIGCTTVNSASGLYNRRDAYAWTPDLWLQVLYKGFRFETEAATIQGQIDSVATDPNNRTNFLSAPGGHGWRLNAWGVATQIQQKLLENRLDLSLGFGWASGDSSVDKAATGTSESAALGLTPGNNGLQNQRGDNVFSTFRFHPSYQVDLILHRNLLTRVQGTYYFRPSVGYDFIRKASGQRLGGNIAGIWTRASEFTQAPGHSRDLGIEANATVYFQSKDGVLNDRPGTLGGFYTMMQYGMLFPLDGLGYPAGAKGGDTSTAQILRWYLGVFF